VEEIGGPATPGIGFGAGIDRLALAAEAEGRLPAPRRLQVFFVLDGAERSSLLVLQALLRSEGIACDSDYAGRSLKGQLTQAERSGAGIVVIAGPEEATVRRSGASDERVPLAELGARLRAWLRP
jgi:histidyl-tRNA synthetase